MGSQRYLLRSMVSPDCLYNARQCEWCNLRLRVCAVLLRLLWCKLCAARVLIVDASLSVSAAAACSNSSSSDGFWSYSRQA